MDSDVTIGIYTEIIRGVAKADSRYTGTPDFSSTWDAIAAEVAAARAQGNVVMFDVPGEVAG